MTVCPFATWRPISANTGRPMAEIRGFAAHSQVGYGDLFDVFNNPARQASTHFWISQQGQLEQYVDTDTQAWAHGPGNPYFWSSEFEGMSYGDGDQEMDGDPFTSAQIDKAGELIAWLHGLAEFPVVVNTDGLAGFGLTPHRTLMQTACPGKLRLSQYPELVLATLRHLDQQPPQPSPPEDDDIMAAATPEQIKLMTDAQVLVGVKAAYELARGPGVVAKDALATAQAISAGTETFAQLEQALHDEK